jgi:GNAT superfamily N-acetyltransferase
MSDITVIRPYEKEDLERVLDLLRISLGETKTLKRTPELFAWKHLDNPFGESIMLVAEREEAIVGFRSFMRWTLIRPSNRELRCVRPVDTATHPDHRRRGIFRDLTMQAIEFARDDGVDLIFNTPNSDSGAGYRAMGWTEVGPIRVQARPSFRAFKTERSARSKGQRSGWIGREQITLEIADRPPRGLRTPRTSDYREWRFYCHPTARYAALGCDEGVAVVRANIRNGRRELIVSDLFGSELDRAMARVMEGRKAADYVVSSFSKGSPEYRTVRRSGLWPVPWISALTLHAYPLTDDGEEAMTLDNWDFALSDLELL